MTIIQNFHENLLLSTICYFVYGVFLFSCSNASCPFTHVSSAPSVFSGFCKSYILRRYSLYDCINIFCIINMFK